MMNNIRIRNKLLTVMGGMLVIFSLVIIAAIWLMQDMADRMSYTRDNRLPSVVTSEHMNQALLVLRLQEYGHLLSNTEDEMRATEKVIAERAAATEKAINEYRSLVSDSVEQSIYDRTVQQWRDYQKISAEIIATSRSGDKAKAEEMLIGQSRKMRSELSATIQELLTRNVDAVNSDAVAAVADAKFGTTLMVGAGGATLLLMFGSLVLLQKGMVAPLVSLTGAMQRLADNDTSVAIIGSERGDEVGAMARTVQVFKDNALAKIALEADQRTAMEARERRTARIEQLIADFDKAATTIVKAVTGNSTTLNDTAKQLNSIAGATAQGVSASSSAATQTSSNVATVAMAAEELSSSIREISRQVSNSNEVARTAMQDAERTSAAMTKLSDAAQEVGQVVDLITGIASQTNLLALNATIEAARAGEAGKGFAVVASEVKNLANQTASATSQISERITAMQDMASGAVQAIATINDTIAKMNSISAAVAAAVEEQNAATQEIARNVQEAARGTDDVTSNINGVAQSSQSLGSSAKNVLTAADNLAQQSGTLGNRIQQFLEGIRAA